MKIENQYGTISYDFETDPETGDRYVHIYNLVIKPEYRRQGRARELISQAIIHIRSAGWEEEIQIVANPEPGTISKIRLKQFYKRMGLEVFNAYVEDPPGGLAKPVPK